MGERFSSNTVPEVPGGWHWQPPVGCPHKSYLQTPALLLAVALGVLLLLQHHNLEQHEIIWIIVLSLSLSLSLEQHEIIWIIVHDFQGRCLPPLPCPTGWTLARRRLPGGYDVHVWRVLPLLLCGGAYAYIYVYMCAHSYIYIWGVYTNTYTTGVYIHNIRVHVYAFVYAHTYMSRFTIYIGLF
jgi:hypothetical protein